MASIKNIELGGILYYLMVSEETFLRLENDDKVFSEMAEIDGVHSMDWHPMRGPYLFVTIDPEKTACLFEIERVLSRMDSRRLKNGGYQPRPPSSKPIPPGDE